MIVAEFDKLANARLEDAQALHSASRFDGAVYLCGHAIEMALKARICRTLNWPEFPGRKGFDSFYTHDLDVLLKLSGQESRVKQQHFSDWNKVSDWKAESRYNIIGSATVADSQAMIQSAQSLLGIL